LKAAKYPRQSVLGLNFGATPSESVTGFCCAALCVAALVYYLYYVNIGFHPDFLSDLFSFRQAQTAVTVQEFHRTGPAILYATPVLGAPWKIPFEFPTYQLSVYYLQKAAGLGLITAGRIVSVAAYLAVIVVLTLVLREVKVPAWGTLLTVVLGFTSPFYIFWSRSFLIETTALFLCLLSFYLAIGQINRPSRIAAIALYIVAPLAAVTKLTTFAPIIAGLATLFITERITRRKAEFLTLRRGETIVVIAIAVSILASILWNSIADSCKDQSPITQFLSSSRLYFFTFGTFKERTEMSLWNQMHWLFAPGLGAHVKFLEWFILGTICVGLVASKYRRWILVFVAMAVSPVLVFFYLYAVHPYYEAANLLYIFPAFVLSVAGLPSRPGYDFWRPALLIAVIAIAVHGMSGSYYDRALRLEPDTVGFTPATIDCFRNVRSATNPDDVVVGIGFDWDPTFPFYLERKAMLLYSNNLPAEWKAAFALQDKNRIKVVVMSSDIKPEDKELALWAASKLGFSREVDFGCGMKGFQAA
jgi:hypothetical protein